MPAPIDHAHTLHSLYMRRQPLGVECRGCGHRALAFADHDQRKGDMTVLKSLRLVCQACGSREWSGWLFVDAADRQAFIGSGGGRPAF